jgi:hypothetical protein
MMLAENCLKMERKTMPSNQTSPLVDNEFDETIEPEAYSRALFLSQPLDPNEEYYKHLSATLDRVLDLTPEQG